MDSEKVYDRISELRIRKYNGEELNDDEEFFLKNMESLTTPKAGWGEPGFKTWKKYIPCHNKEIKNTLKKVDKKHFETCRAIQMPHIYNLAEEHLKDGEGYTSAIFLESAKKILDRNDTELNSLIEAIIYGSFVLGQAEKDKDVIDNLPNVTDMFSQVAKKARKAKKFERGYTEKERECQEAAHKRKRELLAENKNNTQANTIVQAEFENNPKYQDFIKGFSKEAFKKFMQVKK